MLLDEIFDELRPYGSVLINFKYLKRLAQTRKINNIQYYYTINQPSLLISCTNSVINIYTLNNGVL